MDRLTIRNGDGSVSQPTDLRWAEALEKLAAYEDTGLLPEEIREMMTDWLVWKQDEAEERLIVLPCKVGDEVWFDTWEHGIKNVGIRPHKIDRVDITLVTDISEPVPTDIPLWELGKTVFFTPEAAKKALEKKK